MRNKVPRNIVVIVLMAISLHSRQADAQEMHRNTPLMEAAARGDLAEVRTLVEMRHVDVNQTNAYGLNALYFAAGATPTRPIEQGVAGSTEVLHYLLARGADTHAKSNRNGVNALMAAADNKRPDRVKLLLAHGADPNAATRYGDTALTYALRRQDTQSVTLLLDAGARVSVEGVNGDTPLAVAVQSGDPAMVQMILKGRPNINAANRSGETVLANALLNDRNKVARLLLDAGADPNLPSRNLGGMTPLMLAAQNGNAGLIKLLLKKHADVDVKDDFGNTASYYARRYGHWRLWWELMKEPPHE